MRNELSKARQILLWELFAAGGTRMNKDIVPAPDKSDRDALSNEKLIAQRSVGRTIELTLLDKGWRWIADSDPFPIAPGEKRVTAERRLLQSLLRSIKQHAQQSGQQLSSLFRPEPSTGTAPPEPLPRQRPIDDLEDQVVEAFFSIAGRPPVHQVRLRRLREALAHISRLKLDELFLAMRKSGRAKFSQLSNPPDIAAEGDAPIKIKDQDFHTIWIDQ